MELVYQKHTSAKRGSVEKEPEKHCFFFLPFWEKLHQYSVFLQENQMGAFCSNVLVNK